MPRIAHLVALTLLCIPHTVFAAEAEDVEAIESCMTEAADSPPRSCIGKISSVCQEEPDGATTSGMDACISREADAWDSILNERYKAEMASAKAIDAERKGDGDDNASAAADLQTAQRAWIAYRDAECDRRFEAFKDGTIRTTIALSCTLDLTAVRAIDLAPSDP
ncbi:hypothetical protein ASG43_18800 [Aureimonas sp. Leaf454]|uniref:lysozyme inhibitor LprI family protein n=1 Tax=Aureimonas sp. Leaf454 TaxID=1736381 RepID=UPI0006F59CE6|nr:lysozyme inhibitor LprI family protein [Aureimonas sp. Leaf454]KQT53271.1 hypothetical protein ASG43_18800 [Aureimonas sp. Leaf454]